jgi:hypothetical protein
MADAAVMIDRREVMDRSPLRDQGLLEDGRVSGYDDPKRVEGSATDEAPLSTC